MFRHVVLFKWADGMTDERVRAVAAELRKLPAAIGTLRGYQVGPDAGLNPANSDFAVVADFDDAEGYRVYRDHPAHRAVVEQYITPVVASRTAVQYEY
ncbi:MAG: Dabb family protein [Actinobacteria bacterium]|nr:Dabb family protein [Actinomycetota bacterium]